MAHVQDNVAPLLEAVRLYLSGQLQILLDGQLDEVILDNIGRPNATLDVDTDEATYLTLVRTEVDASRKGQRNYRVMPSPTGAAPSIIKRQPPVSLNLYLLITANHTNYEQALLILSEVVAVFQHRNVLTAAELPGLPEDGFFASRQLKFSLLSPSFEEWNHLWSMLGGKHLPAMLYLVQSADIELIPDADIPGSPIREIHLTETLR
ncbi:MAG: hypothetical protein ACI81P_003541 [Neolewinella sp.]|jgi:hypothetical protein